MTNSTQQLMGLLMEAGSPSAPVNLTPPSIMGTVQEGQVLTADTGTWAGSPAPTILTVEWDGAPPPGFTAWTVVEGNGITYTPVFADVGNELRVVVTASNGVSPNGVADSAPVGPVLVAPPEPVPPTPVIT